MTQKRRKADSGKAIGETVALRWEPTHVTKPDPRVVPLQGVDNKSGGTTLASAHALYLNLLSHVWLYILGGWNCCQEIRRGVVYRLIEVEIDIKDINDFNLRTKELGCNY